MSGSKSSDALSAPANQPKPDGATAASKHADQPLGLTVHDLPQAGPNVNDAARARSGRWKMLAVMAMCAAPVIASYFTYYVIRPTQQRSFGELIQAQPMLPKIQATTLDGKTVPLESLKGQWLLVSTASAECNQVCQNHLYLQRQMRETLGKEKDRLDWVWLVTGDAPVPEALQPALGQATVLRVPEAELSEWLKPALGHTLPDHLYVVDPMGHWMMRMPADLDKANAGKAKRDLERLLRASSSWDEAGRPGDAPAQ